MQNANMTCGETAGRMPVSSKTFVVLELAHTKRHLVHVCRLQHCDIDVEHPKLLPMLL